MVSEVPFVKGIVTAVTGVGLHGLVASASVSR